MKKVTVIGSYNVGLFLKGESIPAVGQTAIGNEFYEGGGGKGSNQAVAAAKLGACVSFIGRIGDDKYGQDAERCIEGIIRNIFMGDFLRKLMLDGRLT
jgi:ribokinase